MKTERCGSVERTGALSRAAKRQFRSFRQRESLRLLAKFEKPRFRSFVRPEKFNSNMVVFFEPALLGRQLIRADIEFRYLVDLPRSRGKHLGIIEVIRMLVRPVDWVRGRLWPRNQICNTTALNSFALRPCSLPAWGLLAVTRCIRLS